MKKIISSVCVYFLFSQSLWAEDCIQKLDLGLPNVKVPSINIEVDENSYFCFDENSRNHTEETLKKFSELKSLGVFSSSNCLIEKKYDNATSLKITDLIVQSTKSSLKVYALDTRLTSENNQPLLIMTNSDSKVFINNAFKDNNKNKLTMKDNAEIAASAIGGSLVGIIVERNMKDFKNPDGSYQHDKLLHSNYGALINIGSVGGAYLAIETAGLGDKLGLSKRQKKWAILLTGTLMGILVGYGKERLYDYYHKDIHTYDPHLKGDKGATWLGGGAMNPLLMGAISFTF